MTSIMGLLGRTLGLCLLAAVLLIPQKTQAFLQLAPTMTLLEYSCKMGLRTQSPPVFVPFWDEQQGDTDICFLEWVPNYSTRLAAMTTKSDCGGVEVFVETGWFCHDFEVWDQDNQEWDITDLQIWYKYNAVLQAFPGWKMRFIDENRDSYYSPPSGSYGTDDLYSFYLTLYEDRWLENPTYYERVRIQSHYAAAQTDPAQTKKRHATITFDGKKWQCGNWISYSPQNWEPYMHQQVYKLPPSGQALRVTPPYYCNSFLDEISVWYTSWTPIDCQ